MRIGIVGYGHVGSAMKELFKGAIVYDKYKNIGNKEEINKCDLVFVCVPTPKNDDGSCNTECVDEVLDWLNVDTIVLRSTVPVGYTKSKNEIHKSNIIFQPEYYGETVDHPFSNLNTRKWLTFGGNDFNKVIEAYKNVYNSDIQICMVSSDEAELAKYMENSYLALKVTFCNEFYDIAQKFNIDYNKVREAWLMDPRIGRSHTFVYENKRGFSGSCLPKDISSIQYQAKNNNVDTTLIDAVIEKNEKYNSNL